MSDDIRAEAAQYYDVNPTIPDDIAFYQARLPSSDAVVLELGCGTGRVLLPLAAMCGFVHGIDRSQAMLARCQQKLQAAEIPPSKAQVELGDITDFAQFIGLCSSLKWSRHRTKSPFLALPATAGSHAAYKIISACSNAVS
jgi:SAM-dependent methyltransferase